MERRLLEQGAAGAQGSSAELRELAAEGLGELVDITSEAALKPFVVQITGALNPLNPSMRPHRRCTALIRSCTARHCALASSAGLS